MQNPTTIWHLSLVQWSGGSNPQWLRMSVMCHVHVLARSTPASHRTCRSAAIFLISTYYYMYTKYRGDEITICKTTTYLVSWFMMWSQYVYQSCKYNVKILIVFLRLSWPRWHPSNRSRASEIYLIPKSSGPLGMSSDIENCISFRRRWPKCINAIKQ